MTIERKTRQYEAIRAVLTEAKRPLLAQEILSLASVIVPKMSLATVYRNLKGLQANNLITSVLLPGQNPRYEIKTHTHHHHFQCRYCEQVFEVRLCPGGFESFMPEGFTVEDHELILYGECKECSAQKSKGS